MNRLAVAISQAAREHGSRTALIEGERRLTFQETEALSNQIASAFLALGLAKGERVALLLSNSIEFVCLDLALIKAGLVRVPLNPRLTAAEIEYIVADSGAAVLLYGAAHQAAVAAFRGRLPSLRHRIEVDDAAQFEALLQRGGPEPVAVPVTDDDPYMILYTSGTTGKPKGAVTNLRSRWVTLFHVYANELFVRETDVMLHIASLAHGSGTKVLPFYLKGAANLLMPKFAPAEFCALVQRWRVTATWLVPTTLSMLLEFNERERFDLSSLQTITYAGAPIAAERLREAIEVFGPILLQVYGLSEAPQPDLVLRKEDHSLANVARLGSAGRPALGVSVRVIGSDGTEVAPGSGEIGEILLAGEHIMTGYWGRPEATAEVMKDGWFHTGDLARVDEAGYLYIVDRAKDLIISGGFNVYPREVEEVLYQHPCVAEAAVVGIPDPKWGEAVHAVIALRPEAECTDRDLIAFCRERLADYKCPKTIRFATDLPKSPNGKILKRQVRAIYWQGQERQVHGAGG
ncbi:MAG TPA: long-chain fatty acid--CoA ligase [Symbiobacteriaceae bacterium]|nr:long-chain fatty acid--CoA ligase [Symbiobacteriaceae bacterium]